MRKIGLAECILNLVEKILLHSQRDGRNTPSPELLRPLATLLENLCSVSIHAVTEPRGATADPQPHSQLPNSSSQLLALGGAWLRHCIDPAGRVKQGNDDMTSCPSQDSSRRSMILIQVWLVCAIHVCNKSSPTLHCDPKSPQHRNCVLINNKQTAFEV